MRRLACVLLLCLSGVAPIDAQRLPASQPIATWGPNGYVTAMERAGNRLFLGGTFSYVGPPSGGLALVDVNAPNALHAAPPLPGFAQQVVPDGAGGWLVAVRTITTDTLRIQHLDASGAPVPGWTEPVFGLTGSPSSYITLRALVVEGSRVFAGGYFDAVNGATRPGIVALDVTTGAVLPWNPAIEPVPPGTVAANVSHLAVTNGVVVAAGYFAAVGGVPRPGFAAFDAVTAALTPLAPATCASPGSTVGLVAAANRVYRTCTTTSGLQFDGLQLDGTPLPAWAPTAQVYRLLAATPQAVYVSSLTGQLSALDPARGAAQPGFTPTVNAVDIALAGSRLYVSEYGPIGAMSITAIDAATGAPTGATLFSADVRCLASDGVRVAVCSASVGGIAAHGLAAIDLSTGRAVPVPDLGQVAVNALHAIGDVIVANLATTAAGSTPLRAFSASTGTLYPWSVDLDGGVTSFASTAHTLFAGGTFTTANGQPRRGLLAIDLATAALLPQSQGILGLVSALGTSQGRLYAFGSDAGGGPGSPTVAFDADTLVSLPFAPSPPPGVVRGFGFGPGRVLTVGGVNAPRVAAEWFALDGGAPIDVGNAGRLGFDAWSTSQSGNTIAIVGNTLGGSGRAAIVDARSGHAATWDPLGASTANFSGVHASAGIVAVAGIFTAIGTQLVFNLAVFPTVPLAAPTTLVGGVSGFVASVAWTPPAGGTWSYAIDVGSAPGASDVAVIDVGTVTSVGGTLPPGRYYVRVRNVDGAESSPPSNEVVLQVPAGIAVPGAPGTLSASVTNRVVSLAWGAAAGAASYMIEAGSVSGASDYGVVPLAGTGTTFSAQVLPGTYFVRMRAVNAAGTGASSNEVTVVVP